jgi:hypothetical protein
MEAMPHGCPVLSLARIRVRDTRVYSDEGALFAKGLLAVFARYEFRHVLLCGEYLLALRRICPLGSGACGRDFRALKVV